MSRYFLSLGSNIKPEENLPKCIQKLEEIFNNARVSSIYETDPIGPAGEIHFWNAVVSIDCTSNSEGLTGQLRALEEELGRKRDSQNKFAARPIDIDILPQPGYQKLGFILIPLAELAPEVKDPESGKTFGELAEALSDKEKSMCRKVR